MRRLLQRKLCRRKTLLFTLFLLSLIIGTTPASAKEVTDVLTNAGLINSTQYNPYVTFNGKSFSSEAVYAGKIGGNYSTIQLNATKSNNIVTTSSGGTLKKIKVFWNSNTTKNSLQVYAQNSAFAASTTLSGTALGTLAYSAAITGSDGKKYTEYTFPEGSTYTYVGIAGSGGATYSDSIEITWEDNASSDTRQDVTLSWSESAVSTYIGDDFTAPTLTVEPAAAKPSVKYSSSNTSVAEIADDGTAVTIYAAGQTTITAAIPDENTTYKPTSVSYTLTVVDPNDFYYLVTSLEDFDETQEAILVAWNSGSYQAAMGAQGSGDYRSAEPYSPIATSLPDQLNAPAGTVPFILEPNDDATGYYIKVGEDKYISVNTGSDTTATKEVAKSSASTVTLTINETDNKASLKASSGSRILGYNNTASPKRFASYADNTTYNQVYLYQKQSDALGNIQFSPAAGEVERDTEVTISAKNATNLYYIFDYEETGNGHFVNGSSTKVKITKDCTIEVIAKKDTEQKTASATYKIKAAPLCGAITFNPADGAEVEEGTSISISCENAVKLTYTITENEVTSDEVEVDGSSTTVEITEPCTFTVNAVNGDGVAATTATASYTITPKTTYELVEEYNGNDIPDGDYIFASSKTDGSDFAIMGNQTSTTYRESIPVTLTDNKFEAYSRYAIKVQKEGDGNYSLITSGDKYLYSNSSQDLKEGDNTYAGKWKPTITDDKVVFSYDDETITDGALLKYNPTNTRFKAYKTTSTGVYPISLYTVATTKCGNVIFNPAPGSEVPVNSKVTIRCKNATQISYSITKEGVYQPTVVVPGNTAEVTITENCEIKAYGTNDEGYSEIVTVNYYAQKPYTRYTDFYAETEDPCIPTGDYILVGNVSTGELAGSYYMGQGLQGSTGEYREAIKVEPLVDGRIPADKKYAITITNEQNGKYSLKTAEDKYLYLEATTSGEGESSTTTYSIKESDTSEGNDLWDPHFDANGRIYFWWNGSEANGEFKFNPQQPRFKNYAASATSTMVSFDLYCADVPLCRDLTFDPLSESTVVRGSAVTISCINAAKIIYSVTPDGGAEGDLITVEGNNASVIIDAPCKIAAYAVNAEGFDTDVSEATYTVIDPYVQFTEYGTGSDPVIPDGKYIFVGQNGSTGALSYMADAATATASDGAQYRNAVVITPFEDGRIGVSETFAIQIKKETDSNYSLITAEGKYLYASTTTTGEAGNETTIYSILDGEAANGQGQWTANVAENKVEFTWSDPEKGTLRFNSSASRFKTYDGTTGTKFYLYAPTPKPAQVVCKDATITNDEIKISVNKTITFHSEGAGKMACEVLETVGDVSVETLDIVDGDTYVFTAPSEVADQIVTIIPYDQYGSAYTPSELVVEVYTYDLPKIKYTLWDDEDKVTFSAENGDITEIRPYLIDGTLEEAFDPATYPDNVIPFSLAQPRFKVTAENEIGDAVEESFSFIQELCDRKDIEGGAYSVVIKYKDANSDAVASFPIAETALGSLNWTMDGYLVNESDDILETYPFLIKESYITLHIGPYGNTDGSTILNVKIATPADGGEGVYGAPAHAPAADDLVATVGNYNFVVNGGQKFYFNGQEKNFIKGNIEVSPFEYANIRITSIEDVTTGVSDILEDDAEEVFYNLQGVRVVNPDKGIYIRVKGNKTEKILK